MALEDEPAAQNSPSTAPEEPSLMPEELVDAQSVGPSMQDLLLTDEVLSATEGAAPELGQEDPTAADQAATEQQPEAASVVPSEASSMRKSTIAYVPKLGDPGYERAGSSGPDFYLRMLLPKRNTALTWTTDAEHLELLCKQNDTLEKEIKLYTQYLARSRHGLPATDSPAVDEQREELAPLTVDEKCEIASAEVEAAEAVVNQIRRECESKVAEIRIQMRQLDDDTLQAERDTFDFKRIFVKANGNGSISHSSKKKPHIPATSAEKLLAFLDGQTKIKVAALEKLAIKSSVTKDQGKKLELQLQQHTLGGMTVGAVDYEKLRIENQQQAQILKKRNEDLPRLRLSAGRATQALRSHQVALKTIMGDVSGLQQTLQQSQAQSASIEASIHSASLRSTSNSSLPIRSSLTGARQASDTRDRTSGPASSLPILDYVKLTKENQELSAKLSEMERKYETAVSLTKKVNATLPRAARVSRTLNTATRTGLRA